MKRLDNDFGRGLKAAASFRALTRPFRHFVERQFDKRPKSPVFVRPGQWRVRYRQDGQLTNKITYDVACVYAQIFDGYVIWVRYDDPKRQQDER